MIVRRQYMDQLLDFVDTPVVKVITGMRRCGKSVILKQIQKELLDRGIPKERIFYVNFESLRYEQWKDYRALYETVTNAAKGADGKLYILIDEVQEVEKWEKAVNSFRVDFDCDIYVTGSNAKLLSGELATLLAGRYVEIRVYPLSFAEYLDFVRESDEGAELSEQENFINYLKYGGLPGIHQMKWEEVAVSQYLLDIYQSVLLRDVIRRNQIRDPALLENIVKYLMDNIGNIFSAKTISDFLKNQGRKLGTETVYNYLKLLESAFLIYKVPRFDVKGKRLLETQEKYYLSDLGLRHAVLGYRHNDIGALLENIVFLELCRRGYHVTVGKQGAVEIDFIAEKADERIYIQVCYLLTEENMEREFGPLEAISDNYEKVVLSMDSLIGINRGGIRQKNLVEFLLKEKEA